MALKFRDANIAPSQQLVDTVVACAGARQYLALSSDLESVVKFTCGAANSAGIVEGALKGLNQTLEGEP